MDYNVTTVTVQLILQLLFEVTFINSNTTTDSVTPLCDQLIHDALLELSPCLNQPRYCNTTTSRLVLLYYAADVVIHRI